MAQVYYEKDADQNLLKGKTIAVIGYGSQGHAHSLKLKESGHDVIVGIRPGNSWDKAQADGLKVMSVTEAAKQADIVMILAPDQVQADLYYGEIEAGLNPGDILMFAHGFNIHFNQIVPPADVDVILVAPKGPGHMVRRQYQEGMGVPAIFAIYQDHSGKAKDYCLAYAAGIGSARAGALETTFSEETVTDLFGEQVVLCGGTSELIRAGFDTLVEAGYQPEIAYFECLHELKLIVDLIYENGISGMRYSISETAEYGDLTRGRRIITDETRKEMKKILGEIQDGKFAKEWILENKAGQPVYNAVGRRDSEHLVESVGKELRGMMPWIQRKMQ